MCPPSCLSWPPRVGGRGGQKIRTGIFQGKRTEVGTEELEKGIRPTDGAKYARSVRGHRLFCHSFLKSEEHYKITFCSHPPTPVTPLLKNTINDTNPGHGGARCIVHGAGSDEFSQPLLRQIGFLSPGDQSSRKTPFFHSGVRAPIPSEFPHATRRRPICRLNGKREKCTLPPPAWRSYHISWQVVLKPIECMAGGRKEEVFDGCHRPKKSNRGKKVLPAFRLPPPPQWWCALYLPC